MKITMTIETGDPGDVVRIGQALAGGATMAVTLADTAQVPAKPEKKEAPAKCILTAETYVSQLII